MKNILLPILFIFICNIGFSQQWYDEKYSDCDTSKFTLESKRLSASMDDKDLMKFLTTHLSFENNEKLKGILKLQIIVYTDGTSCLLSYTNDTNWNDTQISLVELKENIATDLVWTNEVENVSVLLEIKFKRNKISFKRYGMDRTSGYHVLKK